MKVRLGFLGCGFMGQLAHMENYARLEDCEIVAVADAKLGQARRVAARYGIPNAYADFRELLDDPRIDAVIAAQPFDNYVNVARDVLRAGKHLFTEKPMCVYAENGRALVRAAEEAGKLHMVGYHKRSDPATEYAMGVIRKWRESGEAGALRYVRISMPPGDWIGGAGPAILTGEPAAAYEPEPRLAGMGDAEHRAYVSFVNYYIHQVNLMRLLLGEDYGLAYADPSGVLLAVRGASGAAGAIEMAAHETSDDWQEAAQAFFQKGWVKIELPAPLASQRAGRVSVFFEGEGGGALTAPVLPNRSAMRNQAMNFLRAVRGEAPPPCDSREAIKDLEFALTYIQAMGPG